MFLKCYKNLLLWQFFNLFDFISLWNEIRSEKNLQNSSISFTSNIKLGDWSDFSREIGFIPSKNNIQNWTAAGIVKAEAAYTTLVKDCVAGGITDGKDVVMFHLCPTMKENQDFSQIAETLKNKIDLSSPNLQGLILGSLSSIFKTLGHYEASAQMYENIRKFMSETLKIQFSEFKGHTELSKDTALSYRSNTDTWMITNDFISPKVFWKKPTSSFINDTFEKRIIAPCDVFDAA